MSDTKSAQPNPEPTPAATTSTEQGENNITKSKQTEIDEKDAELSASASSVSSTLTEESIPEPIEIKTQAQAPQPVYEFPYPGRRIAINLNQIYHEKQSQQHCAVHSINNLLQRPAFTSQHFDTFAKEMSPDSWVNPHKSIFGTGNYDANVLLFALSIKSGLNTTWYNRKKRTPFELLDTTKLGGIIVNIVTSNFLFWEQRHWIPLVPVLIADPATFGPFLPTTPQRPGPSTLSPTTPPAWFNLNPLLNKPNKITVSQYLDTTMKKDKDCIIIFVLLPGVEAEDIWLQPAAQDEK